MQAQAATRLDFYPRPPRGGRRTRISDKTAQIPISIHALREEGDLWLTLSTSRFERFLSTPSARRATCNPQGVNITITQFLSTPSARRATFSTKCCTKDFVISIHALREEGDSNLNSGVGGAGNFYPRPPRGGRRGLETSGFKTTKISIHALREEGDLRLDQTIDQQAISIHALREEGDIQQAVAEKLENHFYPRPPRGGRPRPGGKGQERWLFLSTPSARRATLSNMAKILRMLLFLSTPSARRATVHHSTGQSNWYISIHALREEGDT